MPKFNHAYTIAFSLISDDEQADDVTPAMLRTALRKRIVDLDASVPCEWEEAVGAPFDTFEDDEAPAVTASEPPPAGEMFVEARQALNALEGLRHIHFNVEDDADNADGDEQMAAAIDKLGKLLDWAEAEAMKDGPVAPGNHYCPSMSSEITGMAESCMDCSPPAIEEVR